MSHCKDCKHFTERSDAQSMYGPPTPLRGVCDLTVRIEDAPLHPSSLAVAQDTEGYYASLYVAPEFGCVQFAAISASSPVSAQEESKK